MLLLGLSVTDRSALALDDYDQLLRQLRADLAPMRKRPLTDRASQRALEAKLLRQVDRLFRAWQGTRWGLGMPQTSRPGQGKINCGLFVARVLRDVGFRLPIWKFNRQTATDAIRSLAPRRAIRYFRRAPMRRFLRRVKEMGPGLFLIGLDFHIGFLRHHADGRLRFVHASYVTRRVIDEPAAEASPIRSSQLRVVGKILQREMLRAWVSRARLRVLGNR